MTDSGNTPKAVGLSRVVCLEDDELNPAFAAHRELAETLLGWFETNKRNLPWRLTYAPYEVWISEVMLQQTQMERAAAYFERWMERFPTLRSLAEAGEDDVLKAWEGLGYYSRAKNLLKAARIVMRNHGGELPDNKAALLALPGVGEYTAGAVLSIAHNRPVAAVDANVERVFARLFDVGAPVKSIVAAAFIRRMADALIPEGRARDFNQALMELGALVCSKKPRCPECPVFRFCQARHLGITGERPVPGRKTNYSALEIVTGVLVHNGRYFLQKRLDSGVWPGLWEFPGGRLEAGETPEQAVVREFAEETEFPVKVAEHLGLVRHAYTRYKIAMHCFVCVLDGPAPSEQAAPGDACLHRAQMFTVPETQEHDNIIDNTGNEADRGRFPVPRLHAATRYLWVRPGELERFSLPAAHRKLADIWLCASENAPGAV